MVEKLRQKSHPRCKNFGLQEISCISGELSCILVTGPDAIQHLAGLPAYQWRVAYDNGFVEMLGVGVGFSKIR